ncbi:TIR domain-containing protein [Aeromonas caviae]|uniref:toll/interleukin-1 receptor domain-containing protein n=1 Tax=Aeromonas caviae TaxID=648 RepID=UPI0029D9F3BB|nr:TIR domain-containing protein [Aeromonas caviae]MDX7839450.1 TIR domain-containing protein [Aeromonas caviae]
MPKYHIALSFAGEDRAYVEEVANHLRAANVDVFYDMFEEEDLWGKDLYEHLTSIYRDQAMFTVMFVSEHYVTKRWGTLERKSAQARAFRESSEYILPATFDPSVEVPGMLETTGYMDLNKKAPTQLADLMVRKLVKAGVKLSGRNAYSEIVKSDADYPIKSKGKIGKIVADLRSYNWYTQNPAIEKLIALDWATVSADDAFVLGRNMYQCACGGERRACSFVSNLRRELANISEERAIDLLNGMFFEVYFNSEGEFRGSELKNRKLPELLKIQTVKKYSPSIAFIRRSLDPYKKEVPFLPSAEPQVVVLKVSVKRGDPPTVKSLTANGTELLSTDESPNGKLWRLSYKCFTPAELKRMLVEDWGILEAQLDLQLSSGTSRESELQLPDGTCIRWPVSG